MGVSVSVSVIKQQKFILLLSKKGATF